jgi:hypothetical protein
VKCFLKPDVETEKDIDKNDSKCVNNETDAMDIPEDRHEQNEMTEKTNHGKHDSTSEMTMITVELIFIWQY